MVAVLEGEGLARAVNEVGSWVAPSFVGLLVVTLRSVVAKGVAFDPVQAVDRMSTMKQSMLKLHMSRLGWCE